MKLLKAIGLLTALVVGLLLQPPPANAQKFVKITKIDCTTVSGSNVVFGDTLAGAASMVSAKKGTYVFQASKYTAGLAVILEPIANRVVWQGKINTIRVPGTAANAVDSLKIVYLLKNFAN